jgi:hypothetical protein
MLGRSGFELPVCNGQESGVGPEIWKDAAGASFLPGIENAVDDADCGNDGDYPQNLSHAIEDPANHQQHEALGTLHEADFALGNKGFGASAGVADHHRTRRGDGGENDIRRAAADGIVDKKAEIESQVGVTIEGGVVESAEGSDAILAASDLAVEHVQKTRTKNDDRSGAELSDSKTGGRTEIDEQAKKSEQIGIDARRGKRAYNLVNAPFGAGADRACKSRHIVRPVKNHTVERVDSQMPRLRGAAKWRLSCGQIGRAAKLSKRSLTLRRGNT